MNCFVEHPRNQGISYTAHLVFAMKIAVRLFNSVVMFASHAIFPFIPIRPTLDLEATTIYLQEQNEWIDQQKMEISSRSRFKGQWIKLSLGK